MTTLKKISEHTGLSAEQISGILDDEGASVSSLDIDRARIIIIRSLRAGASGNIQRDKVEEVTAKLLQAKRIKTTEQIKKIKNGMKHKTVEIDGYLKDDGQTAASRLARARNNKSMTRLLEIIKG